MRNKKLSVIWIITSLGLTITSLRVESAPPNDNFADRILFSGHDVSFEGTLEGATYENNPYEVYPQRIAPFPTQTVWWEWSAPVDSTVIFQIMNDGEVSENETTGVGVYDLVDIMTGKIISDFPINTRVPQMFFTFQAGAGTNYQIQFAGTVNHSRRFRLLATNRPVVLQQPQSQSVSVDDSVMFGVAAAGLKPFAYQWQRNGTNLPGETAPILGLEHVTLDMAGEYRLMITNPAGTTFSEPAILSVSSLGATNYLVSENVLGGRFSFKIVGEVGRRHRIESSSDLINWSAVPEFPSLTFRDPYESTNPVRSVVLNATGADSFFVSRTSNPKFYRAREFHAVDEVCNNNLKRMRFGQLLHGYENPPISPYASVTMSDILPFFKNGQWPRCPECVSDALTNSWYSLTLVLDNPRCTINEHNLQEQ